jgi:hypothetical protein
MLTIETNYDSTGTPMYQVLSAYGRPVFRSGVYDYAIAVAVASNLPQLIDLKYPLVQGEWHDE